MRRLHVRISLKTRVRIRVRARVRVRVRVYEVPDHLGGARLSADSKFASSFLTQRQVNNSYVSWAT